MIFFSFFVNVLFSYDFCTSIIKRRVVAAVEGELVKKSRREKKKKKNEEIEIVIGGSSHQQCCIETRVPFEGVKVKSYSEKSNRNEGTHMFILHN
jgi:hypothetical protein